MSMIAVVCALLMAVGIIGIVIPVLPGLLLVWLGVALWSLDEASTAGWILCGSASLVVAVGVTLEYLIPGQHLRRAGVKTSTLVIAVIIAIVMGIVVPVIGAVLGFPLGIYLVQRLRKHDHHVAWNATVTALKAIGLNIIIELGTALVIVAMWLSAVLWWE